LPDHVVTAHVDPDTLRPVGRSSLHSKGAPGTSSQ
jgi:hypothetical protein